MNKKERKVIYSDLVEKIKQNRSNNKKEEKRTLDYQLTQIDNHECFLIFDNGEYTNKEDCCGKSRNY